MLLPPLSRSITSAPALCVNLLRPTTTTVVEHESWVQCGVGYLYVSVLLDSNCGGSGSCRQLFKMCSKYLSLERQVYASSCAQDSIENMDHFPEPVSFFSTT